MQIIRLGEVLPVKKLLLHTQAIAMSPVPFCPCVLKQFACRMLSDKALLVC